MLLEIFKLWCISALAMMRPMIYLQLWCVKLDALSPSHMLLLLEILWCLCHCSGIRAPHQPQPQPHPHPGPSLLGAHP